MNRRLIIRPEAEMDLTELTLWYEERGRGLGLEVTSEIYAAIQRALSNPLSYPRLRKHPQVHRILVRRFPYRIFYILRDDALVVFAVLHAARHERHWKERIHETTRNQTTKSPESKATNQH